VDRNKLQSIERILLDTVSDLQQSQLSRQGCNAASASTKETFSYSEVEELEVDASPDHDSRKRSRRQNHKNEQKNVLMSWFIKHECDPYPNNDEKYALAKAAGLQVRQVEHCELSAAASRRPPSAPVALREKIIFLAVSHSLPM